MNSEVRVVGEQLAELTLDKGCPVCGGAVQVRLSPGLASSVCGSCQMITRAPVKRVGTSLAVDVRPRAQA